ncbi:DUF2075 domain-containing protein [Pelosinus propionicus]|uniref:Schlafen group 3-like DNA/RNA helicase domain-containing protein n=1 Tax=Pelosinus propionicus DSM 13327 TaxID=1123291 RepID=A0A1I4INV1_9FIRM|nr:DUF2075 domain-containing protein [Pelosinus propionicus]SFL55974.1 hypothetical protein SAMN04490355_10093 [Pelosinus propionicus DSM 13327]
MIIYQNDAIGFRTAVDENRIADDIELKFQSNYGRKVGDSERDSWAKSLKYMESILRNSKVPDDCGVLIEYNIPSTNKRIDFIISGYDQDGNANFIIVELKQWSVANATDKEDIVTTSIGKKVREVAHPSYQAYSYVKYLSDMNEAIYKDNLKPYSCAYLHNYKRKNSEPLLFEQYKTIIEETPIFFAKDTKKLEEFINKYVGKGNGLDILYQIENGKIRPSKKFVEYVSEIFDGNKVYTLLDEQKVAYESIIACVKSATAKTTIIVDGGPGTGKSVVAMNAFVELLKRKKNLKFVAPNASFRGVMIDMLSNNNKRSKKRLGALFSGSASFYDAKNDVFDVLVVDEAHRLKKKGAFMYKGENQVEDVVKASRINVFFIDDNQRIRPEDVGTVAEIKSTAAKYKSEVVEVKLEAQFRCAGAEGFLNWVDHNLQIKETANFDGWDRDTFDFMIVDDPNILLEKINKKNEEGFKSRILAGYAWPWTSEKNGNPNAEIDDVKMQEFDFSMPWNSRSTQSPWAIDDEKMNQIGCVHTSQGLEFDYVGVIIGNDLRHDPDTMKIYSSYDDYYDVMGKTGLKEKPEELTYLIKNVYKVLMSRGMKGCYVFCRDKNLQDYLCNRFGK